MTMIVMMVMVVTMTINCKQNAQLSQTDRAAGCVIGEKLKIRAIVKFKVIQGHRCRYQSKVRMRLPISD